MVATARKLEKTEVAKDKKKLRVIKGGKNGDTAKKPAKKSPPTGVKKADNKKAKAKKKKWVGNPNEWRTVLRLPIDLAPRLKSLTKAVGANSINDALCTLVRTWIEQEEETAKEAKKKSKAKEKEKAKTKQKRK